MQLIRQPRVVGRSCGRCKVLEERPGIETKRKSPDLEVAVKTQVFRAGDQESTETSIINLAKLSRIWGNVLAYSFHTCVTRWVQALIPRSPVDLY